MINHQDRLNMEQKRILPFWKFLVFAFVLCVIAFVFENINGRFWLNDFKVYYMAAKALLTGNQVYGLPFGESSGFYKYSPFTLFFFFPYCLVPFEIARIIHFFVLAAVILCVVTIAYQIVNTYLFPKERLQENLLLSFAFICVLIHFVKELHLGNINVVLLLLLCLSLSLILKTKHFLGGILFGLVVLTKPFFLILLLPLVYRKKWKVLVGFLATIFIALLLPAVFFGFSKNIALHKEWITTMFAHNAFYPGHQSIQCLLQYYINPAVPNEIQYLIIVSGALLFTLLFVYDRLFELKNGNTVQLQNADLIMEWFILIALLPNLVKTDSEHFMSTLPLIILILRYLFKKKNIFLILILVVLIFLYGGNSTDLLGLKLSDLLFDMGMIGISNIVLIIFALVIYLRDIRKEISAHSS